MMYFNFFITDRKSISILKVRIFLKPLFIQINNVVIEHTVIANICRSTRLNNHRQQATLQNTILINFRVENSGPTTSLFTRHFLIWLRCCRLIDVRCIIENYWLASDLMVRNFMRIKTRPIAEKIFVLREN